MGAAVRRPDRFRRFCLMNTAAFRSRRIPSRISICRVPGLGAIGVEWMNLFSVAALTMAVSHHERMTPAIKAGYVAPYDSWEHRVAVHEFVKDIPSPTHRSYQRLVEVEEGLAQFRDRPMLLPWGEQDWCFTTDFLDEWLERLPGCGAVPALRRGPLRFRGRPRADPPARPRMADGNELRSVKV